MQTKPRRRASRVTTSLGVLAIGATLGWLGSQALGLHPALPFDLRFYGGPRRAERPKLTPDASARLPGIALEIAPEQWAELSHERDVALTKRFLGDDDARFVPARVSFDGSSAAARVRLKGDLIDHLETDQWSLRIELDDAHWLGMSAFSIQHPRTRGLAAEWIVLEAARREGLLAPRTGFVDVAINGEPKGVYCYEEHFTKELLESQGRRDGCIAHFGENANWSARMDRHGVAPGRTSERAFSVAAAEIEVFDERRARAHEAQLQSLVERMTRVRAIAGSAQASDDERAVAVDQLLDVEATARAHALLAFFGCSHGLYWPNLRFYADPLADRLEPVLYDVGARNGDVDPYEISGPPYRDFLASPRYTRALFEELARFARADYVDGLEGALGGEYERLSAVLAERGYGTSRHAGGKLWDELRERQIQIAELIAPRDAVSLACTLEPGADESALVAVEAWCTTRAPLLIESFEMLGQATSAVASAVAPVEPSLDQGRGVVLLPGDGRHVRFELRVDATLAAVARALDHRAKVLVRYRVVGDDNLREERIVPRRVDAGQRVDHGRPAAPTLSEALARHAFLTYDAELDRLSVVAGDWSVAGDLVVPEGHALEIEGGTRLRFERDAALIASGALLFSGKDERPIVLEPADPESGWAGIAVLGAKERSRWESVVVRGTRSIARGAWLASGGTTFERSALELKRCRFEDANCEDALNVVRTWVSLEDTAFERCASDAFDGDFIDGSLSRCTFHDVRGDAIDVSGSRLRAEACAMTDIGDKGVSIGEASRVELRKCEVRRAKIGVACKDASRADADGLLIERTTSCAIAAYVKKPEYGPSSMRAAHVAFEHCEGRETRAATGCELVIDDRPIATEDFDVSDL